MTKLEAFYSTWQGRGSVWRTSTVLLSSSNSSKFSPKGRAFDCPEELDAFRSLKTVDLDIRAIFHSVSPRVRAHVFLCMLAYHLEWHMRQALAPHPVRRSVAPLAKLYALRRWPKLVVTRPGPGGVCHVGYVDARANGNANALARTIADERARAFDCSADKPIILGATGPRLQRVEWRRAS